MKKDKIGVYIHIPFCVRKCRYCGFLSFPGYPEEMYEIGYEEYFYGDGVCLIEWADQIRELIPETATHVLIEKDLEKGLGYRRITIRFGGRE